MHIVFVDTSTIGLRALRAAKRAGHFVTFVGSRRLEELIGSFDVVRDPELTDQVVIIESSHDEAELLEAARRIAADCAIDAMLAVIETCVYSVAKCARALGVRGTDPTAVFLTQDKAQCRQRVAEQGLASIKYEVVDTLFDALKAATQIGYPLMAKPKRGVASLRVMKTENENDLRRYFDTLGNGFDAPDGISEALSSDTILEHYVEGPLFSVEIAAADGEIQPLILSWRKRCAADPAVELGTTAPAPVSSDIRDAMFEYAKAVVEACELDLGIFHIELIYGPDGPVLVEVNPRIMGGNIPAVFQLATDIDSFELLVEIYATGRLPQSCRNITPVRGASTRNVGPKLAGRLAEDFHEDWDEPFRKLLSAYSYRYAPGDHVPEMNNTFYPFHFQLVRPTAIESSLLAEWIISTTADETGLDLRHSSEDYLLLD